MVNTLDLQNDFAHMLSAALKYQNTAASFGSSNVKMNVWLKTGSQVVMCLASHT